MSDLGLKAIMVVDVLGFKGLTNNPSDLNLIFQRYKEVKLLVEKITSLPNMFYTGVSKTGTTLNVKCRAGFLGDTIFVGSETLTEHHLSASTLAYGYLLLFQKILRQIFNHNVNGQALAFRGAISVGQWEADISIPLWIGPAINEALECEKKAEGAFVFASQSLKNFLLDDKQKFTIPTSPELIQYTVPMKQDKTLDTLVLNPFAIGNNEQSNRSGYDHHIALFAKGNSASVAEKQKNTLAFFDHCQQVGSRTDRGD